MATITKKAENTSDMLMDEEFLDEFSFENRHSAKNVPQKHRLFASLTPGEAASIAATSVAATPIAVASVAAAPVAAAPVAAVPVAAAPVAAAPVAAVPVAAALVATAPVAAAPVAAAPVATAPVAAAPVAAAPTAEHIYRRDIRRAPRPRGRAAGVRKQQERFMNFLYKLSSAHYYWGRDRGRGKRFYHRINEEKEKQD